MKKTLKSVLTASAFVAAVLSLAACGGPSSSAAGTSSETPASSETPVVSSSETTYPIEDDREVYDQVFGKFYEKYASAREEVDDINLRYVKEAEAEADLIGSGAFVPTTTHGGAYTLSHVAPRTVPYVQWGVDYDRVKSSVVTKGFITKEHRATLMSEWQKARSGASSAYDSYTTLKSKLTDLGYTLDTAYKTTFNAMPQTWDALGTSRANDSDFIINGLDGLVEYDNKGALQPALADALPTVSADGLTYTFTINKSKAKKATWVDSQGSYVADVKADDFVAGFQHMLDSAAGLEYLVQGVVKGVTEYLDGTGSFDDVGIKAKDDHTLVITLENKTPYFETMLTYSIFFPMCRSYFIAQGGGFGEDYKVKKAAKTYVYGSDKDHILYNGAFICDEATSNNRIHFKKNDSYYKPEIVNVDEVDYVFDDGSDLPADYNKVVSGELAGMNLSSTVLPLAKKDGNFDKYSYTSDTDSTTFFGGWNLNRRSFALANGGVASKKDQAAKDAYAAAILNQNFRTALSHSIDRITFNAVARGADLAATNLRNMYTSPGLVAIDKEVTYGGHTFTKGMSYGKICQYFIDTNYNGEYRLDDGQDGWYNVKLARSYMKAAVTDLGASFFSSPVQVDIEYYPSSTLQAGQVQAVKKSIDEAFTIDGKQYVVVNLVEAATLDDYYNAGYYAPTGADADYDLFYGSGWGPDFGDPLTYLDTFLPDGNGYMTKVNGLW